MRPEPHSQNRPGSEDGVVDQSVNDALTDLSVYALTLDAERHRLGDRLLELAENDSSVAERRALLQERGEISEEATALRRTITALQEQVSARSDGSEDQRLAP
jgi:hypothetical protein